MGQNPVCYNYRATLISYRSCFKPVETLRAMFVGGNTWYVEATADEQKAGKPRQTAEATS
jgi:hypothetical protein